VVVRDRKRETVAVETPATRATSARVVVAAILSPDLDVNDYITIF